MTKVESYSYWLKQCALLPIPLVKDFDGGLKAFRLLGNILLTLVFRISILVLFPILVPFLAYIFLKENEKVVRKNNTYEKAINASLHSLQECNSKPRNNHD